MKEEEIKLTDWSRWFMGEVPATFLLEAAIRSFIIFLLLVLSMRLLGRRMSAQLSRTEMVAMFSLAAAIGVPLLSPDRGLLPAFIIALVVVGIGRLVARWTFRNAKFESLVQDELTILVQDGTMLLPKMERTRITRQRLFAELRGESIRHLGEVKRVYFEANGSFTIMKEEQPRPGLSVLPETDTDFLGEQKQNHTLVCNNCGEEGGEQTNSPCPNCSKDEWVPAIE